MKKRFLIICLLFMVITTPVLAKQPEDFFQEVTEGGLTGYSRIHKFGHTDNVTRNTYVDVWEGGGIYPHTLLDGGASQMNVSSTDADDTVSGSGAWNISIEGLDGDFIEITEVVQLNGTSPVLTANSFIRVYRAYIRSTGASLANEGTISIGLGVVTAGVPATIIAGIHFDSDTGLGMGQTHMAIYTVPVNKTAYLWNIFTIADANFAFEVNFMVRVSGEGWRSREHFHIDGLNERLDYATPRAISEKSDIKLMIRTADQNADFAGGFNLILLDNDEIGLTAETIQNVNVTNTPLNVNVTTNPVNITGPVQDPTVIYAVILALVVGGLFFTVWGRR